MIASYPLAQFFGSPILGSLADQKGRKKLLILSLIGTVIGYGKYDSIEKTNDNSRNGYSKKTVKTELGPLEINIPRDRNGDFEPKIVPKHQRSVNGIEDKILGLMQLG